MTGQSTPVMTLVREVNDLLSAASVGLYEFVWMLRSSVPDATDPELREYARHALRDLLDQGMLRLVVLEWPKETELGEVRFENLDDSAWDDPADGKPYVALARS